MREPDARNFDTDWDYYEAMDRYYEFHGITTKKSEDEEDDYDYQGA